MGIFDKLFGTQRHKKPTFEHVKRNVDPACHWDLVGKLGEGAFGDVWKAKNRVSQSYAAAKIIETSNESEIEEHYDEIEILMKCDHENIVKCIDSMYWENKLWILIEYCEGGALDDIIEKIDHGLSEEQTMVVVCGTVHGLKYLHSQGIIHRDLKAGNILLLNGEIKLADFGVSALNSSIDQTRDTFIGTPYWMAPEVIMCETSKNDPYTYSADVWSLGVTIIEITQMEPPHNEFSPNRVLMKIARGDSPRLRYPTDYSVAMNKFIEICLQKNPVNRPKCNELLEHSWLQSVDTNKPLRQLLAEMQAEVLEEVVNNERVEQKQEVSVTPIPSNEDSVGEVSSADELTTYEKGIQKKFNSVSSSISSSSSVGNPTVGVTISKTIIGDDIGEKVVNETNVNKINANSDTNSEQVQINRQVEVEGDKKIDASIVHSSTPAGETPTSDLEKTSPLPNTSDIKDDQPSRTLNTDGIVGSVHATVSSADELMEKVVDSKIAEKCSEPLPGNEIIEKKSGGTWFGSKRIKEKTRIKVTDAFQKLPLEKAMEDEALEALDQVLLDEQNNVQKEDNITNKPLKIENNIERRGASRESYKNATTPDLERKPLSQIASKAPVAIMIKEKSDDNNKYEKAKRQKKTLKRTRKFILDGEEVTVTSTVIQSDADVERQSEKRILRRQELQELRKLQIEEQRKMVALQHKLGVQTEHLTQKSEREIYDLNRHYTQKIESMERNQKVKIEKLETVQIKEQKEMLASLKKEQHRELDAFNSNMKQEQLELKKQVAAQFNDRKSRQTTLKNRKTQLDQHQKYKEGAFRAKQDDKLNEAMRKYNDDQKQHVAETEKVALLDRQELIKERESKIWDTEEAHLQEKHQTARSQLKDQFLLQKMLLVVRHDKEIEQVNRHNERLRKALEERQRSDRSRLPKWQRNDGKTRESMFKQSIRIQKPNIDPKEELEKLKDFRTNEEKRQDNERLRQQQKHEKQTLELGQKCEANITELKQTHNEKRRLLVETETGKLKFLDDSFKKKFESWRDKLEPRKQELDEQFSKQMLEWEQFFSQQDLPQTPSGSKRLSNVYRIS